MLQREYTNSQSVEDKDK